MNKKKTVFQPDFRLGVLGGGQLGKMLALAAGNWHVPVHFLDRSRSYPAGGVSPHFTEGDFDRFEDVYRFGKQVDVLTIEIEHVNTEALFQLEQEGLVIHPRPAALFTIKDKGLQKMFYQEHQLPTAPFRLFDDATALHEAVSAGQLRFPFVQKARTAGYDGRGVAVIRSQNDLEKLLPGASVVEERVEIDKELAVIVARNQQGAVAVYPAVEMEFHPEANLVEFLLCPARIDREIERQAEELARSVIEAFDLNGLLAVELFLTKDGRLLINEVAPRPHNSGHHTIDSCYTSQFEQHLRGILNLPLGSTKMKSPSVMVNLLGAEDHSGPARYDGIEDCLAMEGVRIHLYGKETTKPFRKMGHATILAHDLGKAREVAGKVKGRLRIVGGS